MRPICSSTSSLRCRCPIVLRESKMPGRMGLAHGYQVWFGLPVPTAMPSPRDLLPATLVRAVWATVAAARPFEARLHYRADWLAAGVGTDPSCTLTWTADSERLPHLAYAVFQRDRKSTRLNSSHVSISY